MLTLLDLVDPMMINSGLTPESRREDVTPLRIISY